MIVYYFMFHSLFDDMFNLENTYMSRMNPTWS